MNKKCARCEKTVYPTEEVKCLDRSWHKLCFKCDVCGMTLNMKNYKGYDKRPYCNTHYPTTKHTAVAETPEMRRIAENTKIQSNVQYHGDFERSKGTYQCLADNPEILRHKQNQLNSSLREYHSDFEKSKTKYTISADNPEFVRHSTNQKNASAISYHSDFEQHKGAYTQVADSLQMQQQMKSTKLASLNEYHSDFEKSKGHYTTVPDSLQLQQELKNSKLISMVQYKDDFEKNIKGKYTPIEDPLSLKQAMKVSKELSENAYHYSDVEKLGSKYCQVSDSLEMQRHQRNKKNASLVDYHREIEEAKYKSAMPNTYEDGISYHADFEKLKGKKTSVNDDPEIQRIKKNTAIQSNVQYQNIAQRKHEMEARRPEQVVDGSRGRTNPGKISEYEPNISPQPSGLSYQTSNPEDRRSREMALAASSVANQGQYMHRAPEAPRDFMPPDEAQNGQRRQPGSITDYDPMGGFKGQGYSPAQPQPMYQGGYGQPQGPKKPNYVAIYDYTAADDDEVSFREGDVVINSEIIDAGWMNGTIQRTGQSGMLPSNYVEPM